MSDKPYLIVTESGNTYYAPASITVTPTERNTTISPKDAWQQIVSANTDLYAAETQASSRRTIKAQGYIIALLTVITVSAVALAAFALTN